MKRGFLANCATQPDPADISADSKQKWPSELVNKFWDVCIKCFDLRAAKLLEQSVRQGTGTELLTEVDCPGCAHSKAGEHDHSDHHAADRHHHRNAIGPYCFKKAPNDTLGECLERNVAKNVFLEVHCAGIVEKSASVLSKVIDRHRKEESRQLGVREMAELHMMCLRQSISSLLQYLVKKEMVESSDKGSGAGVQFAIPSSFRIQFPDSPFVELNCLEADHMQQLLGKHYLIIDNWIDEQVSHKLFSELEWLEMNGALADQTQCSPAPRRSDLGVWFNLGNMDPVQHPGLLNVTQKLVSLPYELNKNAKLNLQLALDVYFSVLRDGGFIKSHLDNSKSNPHGKKLVAIYFTEGSMPTVGGCLNLRPVTESNASWTPNQWDNETESCICIPSVRNRLVLFFARDFSYELTSVTAGKKYSLFFWSWGPLLQEEKSFAPSCEI